MEPALVSSLFLCEPLWTQSLRAVLQCPSQLLQHGSHLLNWVSHLSQAMGKLMYTLFYMGFNNNNKKWQKQQCMENPASERGRRDMVLPLQMLSKATTDPEQQPCCRAAERQHNLLPGEGPSHKGSIHTKTRWTERSVPSHHPPRCQQALI